MTRQFILAKEICNTLFDNGYIAYFAGGWVRDLLMGHPTNEIDIATSAPPHVIQTLFPKTVAVGIAFGVVVVVKEGINFEVTTFRKDHAYLDGRHPQAIDFSTPQKDAQRRDFTINGMFYDPLTETIYDYVGGQEDLSKKIIRAIGNPQERFAEDRLRMIRAVRFTARFNFQLEENTAKAISNYASTLFPSVSIERIWQEFCKMAAFPHLDQAILMLYKLGLLSVIFPQALMSLAEIQKYVSSFPYFPLETPPIVYLIELFPTLTLEEKLQLCFYLKTTLQDRKTVEFFTTSQLLMQRHPVEGVEWAYFYAHPLAELFLKVSAAKLLPPLRMQFNEEHATRQQQLKPHIERIQQKTPLVSSTHLRDLGVTPGKKMGELLKLAERIAINEDLHHPNEVLKHLPINEISDL